MTIGIALVGTPLAGKTTILKHLARKFGAAYDAQPSRRKELFGTRFIECKYHVGGQEVRVEAIANCPWELDHWKVVIEEAHGVVFVLDGEKTVFQKMLNLWSSLVRWKGERPVVGLVTKLDLARRYPKLYFQTNELLEKLEPRIDQVFQCDADNLQPAVEAIEAGVRAVLNQTNSASGTDIAAT